MAGKRVEEIDRSAPPRVRRECKAGVVRARRRAERRFVCVGREEKIEPRYTAGWTD